VISAKAGAGREARPHSIRGARGETGRFSKKWPRGCGKKRDKPKTPGQGSIKRAWKFCAIVFDSVAFSARGRRMLRRKCPQPHAVARHTLATLVWQVVGGGRQVGGAQIVLAGKLLQP
jgi:hypothetical protein